MTENDLNYARRILAERRKAAHQAASERKTFLFENEPQFRKTEEELTEAGSRLIKAVMSKDEAKAKEIRVLMEDLSARQKDFLRSKGYGEYYLQPAYTCEKCKDTGMTGPEGDRKRCSCYKQLILESWKNESGIPAKNASFDKFDLKLYADTADREKYGLDISPRENAKNILSSCKKFSSDLSEKTKDLLFTGPAGLGKTFLCGCISKELIEKDINVMYTTAYKLFNIILSYFDQDERAKSKSFEELVRTTPVLIIDDLGAESQSEARKALLLDILNDRESNNESYPCKTIISTNLSPKDIFECYGERICSRILGRFKILQFAGDDIRLQRSRK